MPADDGVLERLARVLVLPFEEGIADAEPLVAEPLEEVGQGLEAQAGAQAAGGRGAEGTGQGLGRRQGELRRGGRGQDCGARSCVVVQRARLVQEAREQPLVRVLQRLHTGTSARGKRAGDGRVSSPRLGAVLSAMCEVLLLQ